jgi:glyoxylase-like metal-dependent hydrolase (beta-lactamase superfamily II)
MKMSYEIERLSLGGIGNFNCYLIKTDEGFVLIDTGVSRLRGTLEELFETAGCAAGNLKLIILTNGTMDAMGNAAFVRQKYGSQIAMHSEDLKMVEDGEFPQRQFKSKFPEVVYKLLVRRIGKKMTASLTRFHPDLFVEDGFDLSEFGLPAHILHTPGFTPGSICILFDDGTLISGNTIINQGKSFTTPFVLTTYEALGKSIDRLKSMKLQTIYPGMGNPLTIAEFQEGYMPQ